MPPIEVILDIVVIGIFIIYWVVAFIILYHLARFGVGVQPKKFSALFFTGSVILSAVTLILFLKIDITKFLPL